MMMVILMGSLGLISDAMVLTVSVGINHCCCKIEARIRLFSDSAL